MSEKYCSAGKVECVNYLDNWKRPFCCGELNLTGFEQCPWPSKQVPVEDKRIQGFNIENLMQGMTDHGALKLTVSKLNEVIDAINESRKDAN